MLGRYAEKGHEMICQFRAAALVLMLATAVPAFAQMPMSPVYPTGPMKTSPTGDAEKSAPTHARTNAAPGPKAAPTPGTTSSAPPQKDDAVATAVIPPPSATPSAEGLSKAAPPSRSADNTASPGPNAKPEKRTARQKRYARRYHAPYAARWPYGYGAPNSGWRGGPFGPAPYSASGL